MLDGLVSAELIQIAIAFAQNLIVAILILIVGFWLAGRVSRWVKSVSSRTGRIDDTLSGFFSSLAKYAVIVFVCIAAIQKLGVPATSFIAVLGAAGLAVGLALQGTLGHLASGVMLLIFRPFSVGDYVDAGGVSGTVKAITLFTTEMASPDNVKIIVPNGVVWGGTVKNYGAYGTRRLDLTMGISYDDDIDKAMQIMDGIIKSDDRILSDPESMMAVGELADSSVNIIVRVWCQSGDYWGLKFDLTKRFKEAFDKADITIPFPQQVVHHINGHEDAAA